MSRDELIELMARAMCKCPPLLVEHMPRAEAALTAIEAAGMRVVPVDPATDEALVERMARAICDAAWGHGSFDRPTEQCGFSSEAKEQARGQALAAIRAMEEKP